MQETGVQSLGQEDPVEKEMATHSSVLAWEIHGQRSLVGYSPWGHKESDTTEINLANTHMLINYSSFPTRVRSLRPCSDSSTTPSFPSQPEGKIGLPYRAVSCIVG